MSKKIVDVDNDLSQFKTDTGERFTRIEESIATFQADVERKHAEKMFQQTEVKTAVLTEMMTLLMEMAKPQPPPGSQSSQPSPPILTVGPSQSSHQPPPLFPSATTVATIPPWEYTSPVRTIPIPPPLASHIPPPLATIPLCMGEDRWSLAGGDYNPHGGRVSNPMGYEHISHSREHYNAAVTAPWDTGSGYSGERGWVPGADHHLRKLRMPIFNGEDVYGWVVQAEHFFDIQGFRTTAERLRATVTCLEGHALSWYGWINRREPFHCWEHLKVKLLARFQSSEGGTLHEQLMTIDQSGSAREYVNQFETLAAQLEEVSEPVLEGAFIKGLKPELHETVLVFPWDIIFSGLNIYTETMLVMNKEIEERDGVPEGCVAIRLNTRRHQQ